MARRSPFRNPSQMNANGASKRHWVILSPIPLLWEMPVRSLEAIVSEFAAYFAVT